MVVKIGKPGDNRTAREINQWHDGYDKGHRQGVQDGQRAVRKTILDHLEAEYMKKDVIRGEAKAEAILEVTRGISEVLKNAGM